MKKTILLLTCFIFCPLCMASFVPSVPENTMQIAQEAKIKNALMQPMSEIVRVGIGDTNFATYNYKQTDIFGTNEIAIYDKNTNNKLATVSANQNITVNFSNGIFHIKLNDENATELQINGPVRFACEKGFLGIKNLKRAGHQALYRGEIELVKNSKNTTCFNIVNVIEVEEYLKGVVPNEMPVTFGLEALKAQAVAARNYVLSPRTKAYPAFDVADSVASQVYFGVNTEKPLATRAVEETEGVVAIYGWDLILAQYCSTHGGYSESFGNVFSDPSTKQFPSYSKPYLVAKPDMLSQLPIKNDEDAMKFYGANPDSYDMKSPYHRWQRTWTKEELQNSIKQNIVAQSSTGFIQPAFRTGDKLDDIKKLVVKQRGESGKIIELDIVTKSQTYHVYKELVIRRLLTNQGKALPSANIAFKQEFDEDGNLISITAFGGGYGHGVGMSQYGAGFMATNLKYPYDKILKHYYTGITLATKPLVVSGQNNIMSTSFYTNNNHTELVIDNKYKIPYFLINVNGKEHKIELTGNMFNRVERIDISNFVKQGKNTVVFYYPEDIDKNKGIRVFVEVVAKDEQ